MGRNSIREKRTRFLEDGVLDFADVSYMSRRPRPRDFSFGEESLPCIAPRSREEYLLRQLFKRRRDS
jgi:hypothetical protein